MNNYSCGGWFHGHRVISKKMVGYSEVTTWKCPKTGITWTSRRCCCGRCLEDGGT